MRPFSDRFLLFFLLVMTSFACAIPGVTVPDADPIRTAAAQTVIANLTQTTAGATAPVEAGEPSATPIIETITPTWTASPSPTITLTATPLYTPTALIPQISVSVDTNCRVGPGRVYPRVGALLVGEVADVYGRDPTGRYWYIRNLDAAGYCWVWGEYAALTGPYLYLPVFTPPPTPTPTFTPTPQPDFKLAYDGSDSCSGWWLEIRVKNTGSSSFRSIIFEIEDQVTNQNLTALGNGFVNVDGCSKTTTKDALAPGDEFVVSSPIFAYDPKGNEMLVHLTLCSQASQKGECVKRKVKFTP